MTIVITKKATKEDLKRAAEEFEDYIKIVVDIERKILTMGGKLHADAEKILLENGSKQKDIWGGGIKISTKEIDCQGIINIRPNQGNSSMEILDPKIRKKFLAIASRILV